MPKIKIAPLDDLRVVLRYAMVKIGLRSENWPKAEEKTMLFQHIIENYGNHTCEEIRLAFDMAIAGKLNVDPVCYENFSCLYFSQVMNAYRAWSAEIYKQLKPVQKAIEYKPDLEQIEKEFQEFKNSELGKKFGL